jgi:hypothetical protein
MLCCAPYAYDHLLLQLLVVCLQFFPVVVASCWLSIGVVQLSVMLLLHARTHLTHKKKKIAPVARMVVVTRRSLQYAPHLNTEKLKVNRFMFGINDSLRAKVRILMPQTLNDTVQKALIAEEELISEGQTRTPARPAG